MKTGKNRNKALKTVALAFTITIVLLSYLAIRDGGISAQKGAAINQAWVDQHLAAWTPTKVMPMDFGVLLGRASYEGLSRSYNTAQVETTALNALGATSAGYIRIDIDYSPWLNNNPSVQSEVTSLINQVRTDGKGLIIADAGAQKYYNNPITWSQFQSAWVQRVTTLASLYHPDYYIIVKEPGWYVPMVSDATTNPDFANSTSWLTLTQSLVNVVQTVSPNTKIGVSVAASDLTKEPQFYTTYLPKAEALSGISFSGYDIYTTGGYNNTQSFLAQYGDGGKGVWIAECWSGTASVAYDASRASLDAGWIAATYYFAQLIHAQMMIPFFTTLFSSYSLTGTSPTDPSQIISLLGQHTPVFYSYQSIISSNAAGVLPITTTTTSAVSTGGSTNTSSSIGTTTPAQSGGPMNDLLLIAAAAVVAVVAVVLVVAARRRT